ncbi:MAG: M48 family metalloprotease [Deltaproteobacteria bacterium]|nr:M48 family metalloprotease [Deltaproteobacteria bacterium]
MRGALLSASLLSLLAGCVTFHAGMRLQQIGLSTSNRLISVDKRDFPDGNPRRGTPTCIGSEALQQAALSDPQFATYVFAHGIPDGIAVGDYVATLDLAYLSDHSVVTLAHLAPQNRQVIATRPLSEDDRMAIDPHARAVALRQRMANFGRLSAVSTTLTAHLPPLGGAVVEYGFVLLPASETAAEAFGGAPQDAEKIVTWVMPDGPASQLLRVGDRVVAIDGVDVPVADRSGTPWQGAKRLRIRRATEILEVEVAPQTLPNRVVIVLDPSPTPNAFVMPGGERIVVTEGLLTLLPEDDALASVLGHEYAHIVLGHAEAPNPAQRAAVSVAALGLLPVLLPSDIVRPGTSRQVVQAMHKGFSRDQERDADRLGLQYARAAGYDPQAALVVLDRMQAAVPVEGVDQFFDLHPPYPERRALIEAELASAPAP